MAGAGVEMVRYADDFVLLCRTEDEAGKALECVRNWTAEAGFTPPQEKARIVNHGEKGGCEDPGSPFEPGEKWTG